MQCNKQPSLVFHAYFNCRVNTTCHFLPNQLKKLLNIEHYIEVSSKSEVDQHIPGLELP